MLFRSDRPRAGGGAQGRGCGSRDAQRVHGAFTLASHPVRTWSRDDIIRSALGDDFEGFDRTVDAYVKNLRKKLAEPGHENGWIRTVYGFGYRIDDSEPEERS